MAALVAYFSAGGQTRRLAQTVAAVTGAELFEIKPEVAYTKADLNWSDKRSRSSVEMADSASRPALAERLRSPGAYDTVYLGFPIWWYVAPTIVNTFLESCDFSGVTVIPFATSGGSGYGNTEAALRASAPSARFKPGSVLPSRAAQDDVKHWLASQ